MNTSSHDPSRPDPHHPPGEPIAAPLTAVAAVHQQVRDAVRSADTKATSLLPLLSLAVAGVVALTSRSVPLPAGLALTGSGAMFGAAVLALLAAILPPPVPPKPDPDRALRALRHQPDTHTVNDVTRRLAEDTAALAAHLVTKQQWLRRAILLLGLGLGLLAVALLLAVLLP